MLEVILENGEPYDLNGLKGYINNFGRDYILSDMANGNFPLFLQHNNHRDYLGIIFDHAEKQKQNLNLEEKRWLSQLQETQNNIDDLIFGYFTSNDKNDRSTYLTRCGVKLAKLFDSLTDGYVNENSLACPACPEHEQGVTWESWKKEISALNYFVQKTRRIYASDKSGIKVPIDLNIVSDQ